VGLTQRLMADFIPTHPESSPDRGGSPESAPISTRLHGNSTERRAAARLRADLIAHCGGRPSATQMAMIEQATELKLRLAVMDQDFIRTSRRSAHASRDYLAWSNSMVRLLRQLGLKGAAENPPDLQAYLAARAKDDPARRLTRRHEHSAGHGRSGAVPTMVQGSRLVGGLEGVLSPFVQPAHNRWSSGPSHWPVRACKSSQRG
jgi:hypothetical protein